MPESLPGLEGHMQLCMPAHTLSISKDSHQHARTCRTGHEGSPALEGHMQLRMLGLAVHKGTELWHLVGGGLNSAASY